MWIKSNSDMKTIDAGRSDARSSAWCRSSGAAVLAERYTHVKVMNFRSAPADGTIFLRARRRPSNISSTTPDRESHNDHLYHEQRCPSTRNRRLTVHQPRNRSGRGRISGVRKLSNKVQTVGVIMIVCSGLGVHMNSTKQR